MILQIYIDGKLRLQKSITSWEQLSAVAGLINLVCGDQCVQPGHRGIAVTQHGNIYQILVSTNRRYSGRTR